MVTKLAVPLSMALLPFTLPAEPTDLYDTSFVCVADNAIGFSFDSSNGKWQKMVFRVVNSKYVVQPLREENDSHPTQTRKFGVWRVGESNRTITCEYALTKSFSLVCHEPGFEFTVNAVTKRFQFYYAGDYVSATLRATPVGESIIAGQKVDEGGEGGTPLIEIGKCTEIEAPAS